MSKRIEIASGVSVSPEVKTTITVEEYNKCSKLIPDNVTVEETSKGFVLSQEFDNVKELILDGFNSLTDEQKETLALREYKTRDFQDSVRTELRNTLNLTTSMSTGSRELMKKLKENPKELAALLEKYNISK